MKYNLYMGYNSKKELVISPTQRFKYLKPITDKTLKDAKKAAFFDDYLQNPKNSFQKELGESVKTKLKNKIIKNAQEGNIKNLPNLEIVRSKIEELANVVRYDNELHFIANHDAHETASQYEKAGYTVIVQNGEGWDELNKLQGKKEDGEYPMVSFETVAFENLKTVFIDYFID